MDKNIDQPPHTVPLEIEDSGQSLDSKTFSVDPYQWELAVKTANLILNQSGEADWASLKCGGGPHRHS